MGFFTPQGTGYDFSLLLRGLLAKKEVSKCFIQTGRYALASAMTQWLFYFLAIGFSGLTALFYLASAYSGRPLLAWKFWIGFLTRGNSLFRIGFLSELSNHGRELDWGFSFCVLRVYGRTIDVAFIHYLSPAGPFQVQQPNSHARAAMRDAMKLLASVVKYFFLHL
jgi:hypothetical protein